MLDRFKVLTASLESSVQNAPAVLPPLSHFRAPTTADAAPILGLAPGAQWDTKRWPAGHFAELLRLYRNAEAGQVRIYLGPREAGWFPHSDLARIAAQDDAVELVQLPDLPAVAQSLATRGRTSVRLAAARTRRVESRWACTPIPATSLDPVWPRPRPGFEASKVAEKRPMAAHLETNSMEKEYPGAHHQSRRTRVPPRPGKP